MADKEKPKEEATPKSAKDEPGKKDTDKESSTASSSSRASSAVPGVKRRPHTIDLKADEVKEDPKDAKAEASGKPSESKGKSASADKEAKTGASSAKPSATKSPDRKPSGKEPAGKQTPPQEPAQEPPQRTTPRQVAGFVTHLAAGLVGGVVGILAFGYGQHYFGIGLPDPAQNVSPEQVAALESRIAKTEEALAAQGDIPGEIDKRAAALDERITRTEQSLAAQKDFPGAIQDRVGRLEATLKALEQAASEGGDVAQTAAIRSQIDDIAQRFDTQLEGLKQEISAVSQKAESQAASAPDPQALVDVASRINALEDQVGTLKSAAPERVDQSKDAAALAISLTTLTRAAEQGEPFAAELAALRAVAPADVELAALQPYAENGVPTPAQLERQFPAAAEAARNAASPQPKDDSVLSQFLQSAQSVVKVRKVAGAGGGGADAILASMSEKLRAGNLDAAVDEAGKLPDAERAALAPWLEKARARIALEAALKRISGEVTRSLTSANPAQSGKRAD